MTAKTDYPNLPADVRDALTEYDASVADGTLTFASNGHRDSATHPEVWLPSEPTDIM